MASLIEATDGTIISIGLDAVRVWRTPPLADSKVTDPGRF